MTKYNQQSCSDVDLKTTLYWLLDFVVVGLWSCQNNLDLGIQKAHGVKLDQIAMMSTYIFVKTFWTSDGDNNCHILLPPPCSTWP